jgi:hypothetical protein
MARPASLARRRRMLAGVLAALAVGMPTAAHPMSLAQLLRLPLEQLLRLEFTAAADRSGGVHGR